MALNQEIWQKIEKLTKEIEDLKRKIKSQDAKIEKLEKSLSSALVPPPPPFEEKEEISTEKKEILPKEKINLEKTLGANWLTKIGVLALIIGIGFFLKYAIDKWGIGPTGRIIGSLIGGIVLIFLGEYFKEKYPKYSQVLTGGGIAILYFSAFAAFNLYQLIDLILAFLFMTIVTLTAGVLSLRYNALPIAFIGIIGGFFTPFMLGVKNFQTNPNVLFGYIVLLNLGILGICSFKNWRILSLFGLIFTYLSFGNWFLAFYKPENFFYTQFVLTVFFLLFVFITLFYHFLQRKKAEWQDLGLMTINAFVYFAWSYDILIENFRNFVGFFAAILALFYFILAYFAYLKKLKDTNLILFLSAISLLFLTIAIPLQLRQYWITIAWVTEGVILSWLGFRLKSYHLRSFSLLVFSLALIRLFFYDMGMSLKIEEFSPIFNKRFFVFFFNILAFYLASYIWYLGKKEIKIEERFVLPTLLILANFLTFWILSFEISGFFDKKIVQLRQPTEITIYDYQRCLYYQKRGFVPKECLGMDWGKIKNFQFLKNLSISLFWALYAIILSLIGIFKNTNLSRQRVWF